MKIPGRVIAVSATVAGVIGAGAVVGWAVLDEDGAQRHGTCGTVVHELGVEPEDGALEVNFELESATPGEEWGVVVRQDATALFEGRRTTDEDGELDVDVPARSSGGRDFAVTATPASGEPCTVQLTYQ